ncbi:MAG: flagellar brake domain-containing protein [Syntrophomonas sp.]
MANINYKDFIKINQLVEIELDMQKDGLDETEAFASRIEDMGKNWIMVAAPYRKGAAVPVHPGTEVQIRVGKEGSYYLFHTRLLARQKGRQPMLQLSEPFKITKIQMRSWVRVPASLPVCYKMAGYEMDFYEANTADISGGGVLILLTHPVDKDTLLDLEVKLPGEPLKTKGLVTRCIEQNKFYQIGISFQDLEPKEQESVVAYVFQKQREHIKKGVAKR